MAPEYIRHGRFSVKSDVFSFGVLVLEIIIGQKNNDISYAENGMDLLNFVSLFFLSLVIIISFSRLEIVDFRISMLLNSDVEVKSVT